MHVLLKTNIAVTLSVSQLFLKKKKCGSRNIPGRFYSIMNTSKGTCFPHTTLLRSDYFGAFHS